MKKNRFKHFLMALSLALGSVSMASCGGIENKNYCDISNVSYGFVKKVEGMAGPDGANKVQYMDLEIGSTYWLIFEFDSLITYENNGNLDFYSDITLNNIEVIHATMADINSGKPKDIIFTNPDTGEKVTGTRITYALPRHKDEVKSISIVIELTPISVGSSNINLEFGSDTVDIENRYGPNKQIKVISVTIQTPVLKYDELSQLLIWTHVPNADTYLFIKDNELMEYKYKVDEYVEEWQEITLTLDKIGIFNPCRIKIQAINSENAQFHASNYSNTVEIRV